MKSKTTTGKVQLASQATQHMASHFGMSQVARDITINTADVESWEVSQDLYEGTEIRLTLNSVGSEAVSQQLRGTPPPLPEDFAKKIEKLEQENANLMRERQEALDKVAAQTETILDYEGEVDSLNDEAVKTAAKLRVETARALRLQYDLASARESASSPRDLTHIYDAFLRMSPTGQGEFLNKMRVRDANQFAEDVQKYYTNYSRRIDPIQIGQTYATKKPDASMFFPDPIDPKLIDPGIFS